MNQKLKNILQTVANARRTELIPVVYHFTQGKVQTGPFTGMTILPYFMWGDGDTASKLLGEYENELHFCLDQAIQSDPDVVINVGCAEGYYAVGLGGRTKARIYAADIEPSAQLICQANASANGVAVELHGEVNPVSLRGMIADHQRPLVVCDCEGYEDELLDLVRCPELKRCMILVETHDNINPNLTNIIAQRFHDTHQVVKIRQDKKDPYQFSWLDQFSDCDKWCLVHEGRPQLGHWLWMQPK